MVDDYLTKNITAADVATFLATNPNAITNMLTAHPELLAIFLAAAANHSQENKHIDSKVIDLIPAIAAKASNNTLITAIPP